MKVLVDATMLDGGPSGAATRLAALGAAHARRGEVEVVHLTRPDVDPLPGLTCLPLRRSETPLRRALAGSRLERLLSEQGAALLQAGALPLARLRTAPQLVTVHDLRFLHEQGGASLARRLWARHRLGPNLERAAAVVAVSRVTADELVARRLAPAERVTVVPNAGTPGLQREQDADRLARWRRTLGLNSRYVLALGPIEPHKRPGFLLQVLAEARRDARGADLALVWAGRSTPDTAAALMRRAADQGLAGAVHVAGLLDENLLATALSAADALAAVGPCEGFSIPVVDAQRFGVPVLAVRSGALVETAGEDTAWMVPADDVSAGARGLLAAVTPGDERSSRLRKAREAAGRWSWEASAERLERLWEVVGAQVSRLIRRPMP
jgi:glycosyltransferase involved in cell wall biosynthesis